MVTVAVIVIACSKLRHAAAGVRCIYIPILILIVGYVQLILIVGYFNINLRYLLTLF